MRVQATKHMASFVRGDDDVPVLEIVVLQREREETREVGGDAILVGACVWSELESVHLINAGTADGIGDAAAEGLSGEQLLQTAGNGTSWNSSARNSRSVLPTVLELDQQIPDIVVDSPGVVGADRIHIHISKRRIEVLFLVVDDIHRCGDLGDIVNCRLIAVEERAELIVCFESKAKNLAGWERSDSAVAARTAGVVVGGLRLGVASKFSPVDRSRWQVLQIGDRDRTLAARTIGDGQNGVVDLNETRDGGLREGEVDQAAIGADDMAAKGSNLRRVAVIQHILAVGPALDDHGGGIVGNGVELGQPEVANRSVGQRKLHQIKGARLRNHVQQLGQEVNDDRALRRGVRR